MTTVIRFTGPAAVDGEPMSTYVTEALDEVFESWNVSRGAPFKLTHEASGSSIYVNPQNIACWFEQGEQQAGV